VKGLRLALPKEFFGDGLDPEVRAAVMEAVTVFERCGATVQEVSLPHAGFSVPTYYMVATAEASSNLARFDGVRYGLRVGDEGGLQSMYSETRSRGFGAEVKRRIMLGTYALSAGYYDAYYLKALSVRTLIRRDFDAVFEQADLVVTPTAPTTAFRIGEKAGDPLQMYLSDVYTIAANLAGLPAISLPCGFDAQGLPIGVQLIARDFDEQTLLNASLVVEEEQQWYLRTPPLSNGANSR
jgi:aspartyl-tRNA(Asn)/glutamyl-tRNA(Gln) amidotransferase subunit A